MDGSLVVVRPFAKYRPGDVIDDTKLISEIISSQNVRNVVRVASSGQTIPHRREV